MALCKLCFTRLDDVWAGMGYDSHPGCTVRTECVHGEPRGPRYCALCRRANPDIVTPEPDKRKKSVDRDVVLVGHNHPETSKAAAARALPASGTKRAILLDAIKGSADGLCDFELEQRFAWKHESASACRRSLVKDGWLRDSGRRRKVPDTGNDAIVWVYDDGRMF